MDSKKSKQLSDEILRREMENQMTEDERIAAARMARIAELAERKNSQQKHTSAVQDLVSPQERANRAALPDGMQKTAPVKIRFISKAERERQKKEREEKERLALLREKRDKKRRIGQFSREEEIEAERKRRMEREEEERKRQRQQEFDDDDVDEEYKKAIEEGIKKQYIGEEKRKKKRKNTNGPTFKMQWDNDEDTSEALNPLYKSTSKVHLGFGKGYIAGVDMRSQRKESDYMETLLQLRKKAEEENGRVENAESEDVNRLLVQNILQKHLEKDEQIMKRDGSGNGTDWREKPLEAMTARDWRIMREEFDIKIQGGRSLNPIRTWDEAPLYPGIRKAIEELGYKEPSPIQRQAIPVELKGKDLIGIAKTGSGKTCAFVVPMLQYIMNAPIEVRRTTSTNGPLAVIMAPTYP